MISSGVKISLSPDISPRSSLDNPTANKIHKINTFKHSILILKIKPLSGSLE